MGAGVPVSVKSRLFRCGDPKPAVSRTSTLSPPSAQIVLSEVAAAWWDSSEPGPVTLEPWAVESSFGITAPGGTTCSGRRCDPEPSLIGAEDSWG